MHDFVAAVNHQVDDDRVDQMSDGLPSPCSDVFVEMELVVQTMSYV
jgi:hypothetical protein